LKVASNQKGAVTTLWIINTVMSLRTAKMAFKSISKDVILSSQIPHINNIYKFKSANKDYLHSYTSYTKGPKIYYFPRVPQRAWEIVRNSLEYRVVRNTEEYDQNAESYSTVVLYI